MRLYRVSTFSAIGSEHGGAPSHNKAEALKILFRIIGIVSNENAFFAVDIDNGIEIFPGRKVGVGTFVLDSVVEVQYRW